MSSREDITCRPQQTSASKPQASHSPSSSSEYHPSLRPPPRSTTKPEARKGAFDLGNDGHANSMSLQVDESAAMPVDDALVHNHFGV
ncbi:hypothetical protein VCV18_004787 [Metarhizium anisopliae]